jgi:hypothetical protein
MTSRFVLDLRKAPPPPPLESDSDRCVLLQNDLKDLKQTNQMLLLQLSSLAAQLEEAKSAEVQSLKLELDRTNKQMEALKDDHDTALKLIVTLSKDRTVRKQPVVVDSRRRGSAGVNKVNPKW